jgi:hypothetical protein
MKKSAITGLAVGVLLAAGASVPAMAVEDGMAELSVLHGIPATPVDVWVNGTVTLEDFQPGSLAGPLDLAPGDYTFVLTAVGDPITSPVLSAGPVALAADTSYTAVAHLKADGTPTVTPFVNDISATKAGEGRLTVRHVAQAPAVDILANDAVAFAGLENPNEVKADLGVGTIAAKVNLAGTATTAIGPADVPLSEGVNTVVYAWGNAEGEPSTLALAVQNVDVMMGSPSGVAAGSAPVETGNTLPLGLVAIAVLALAGAGVASRVAVTSRR